jgi:hypothetical protein
VPTDPAADLRPLPAGTRLVHIGFHKSGTTAVQEAFMDSRDRLAALGIGYPQTGGQRHHGKPALAVAGLPFGWKTAGFVYPESFWTDLVAEIDGLGQQTVVVSSEHLAEVPAETVGRIITDLGPDRVHVVATLRPLDKILPSSWQQKVKNGLALSYVDWLAKVLADPLDPKPSSNFWARHSHGVILSRWAAALGADRVTLVVLDDADKGMVFRAFESLLGVPSGTLLVAQRRDDNRSMSEPESELVQRVAQAVRGPDVDWDFFYTVVRSGVAQRMVRERVPADDEPRLATPQWALDRAAEIGARSAEQIAATGITVVGDLASLGRYTSSPGEDHPPITTWVPMDAAVEAVVGAIESSQVYAAAAGDRGGQTGQSVTSAATVAPALMLGGRPVKEINSRQLAGVLAHRVTAKLRAMLHRGRH